jgi:AbrB family looped-hinge helix DNA binding protein
MAITTMTSKGQVTIPKEVRDALKLRPGDKISMIPLPDGRVIMRAKKGSILDLYGALHRPGRKPLTLEQMKR